MRIALASQGPMGAGLIDTLHRSRHEVVVHLASARGVTAIQRGLAPMANGLFDAGTSGLGSAFRRRIPTVWIDKMEEAELAPIRAAAPDLLLSADFGVIFPARMLQVPTIGAVNVHWSLLPHYRGPNPSSRVILAGEERTGVTFHVTTRGIDRGDILEQVPFAIGPRTTPRDIYVRACGIAKRRVLAVLDRIEAEGLVGRPQPPGGTYFRRLRHGDVELRWERPAFELERLVRGSVSPMAWLWHRGRPVFISKAAVAPLEAQLAPGTVVRTRPATIATGSGALALGGTTWRPVPFRWPAAWDRLQPGEVLDQAPATYLDAVRVPG